jgi:transposase, IS30 family
MKNNGHHKLDIDDRMIIQACLHDHQSLTQIATRLKVSKSTICRELARNYQTKDEKATLCPLLKKVVVCNVCKKKGCCPRRKRFYNFITADELSQNRRKMSRSNPKLSNSIIKGIDEVVAQGVSLGQSLHHIYMGDVWIQGTCCERTVRRLVYRGNLSIRPHQLRRYVTYKRSYVKTKEELQIRDIRCLIGRTYKDFVRYCIAHKKENVVQYDSVIGKIDDQQAILTITFPKDNFQFGLLIQKGNANSTIRTLKHLFATLGNDLIKKVFPVNLADNGTEFSTFHHLECDARGEMLVRCFFTNPYRSTDKAHCERNHEFIRYCIPKGKSLDFLTQDSVNDLFSNINSYTRASKGDQTPYDLVKKRFGQTFLDLINIKRIPNKKVKLTQIT